MTASRRITCTGTVWAAPVCWTDEELFTATLLLFKDLAICCLYTNSKYNQYNPQYLSSQSKEIWEDVLDTLAEN